MKRVVLASAASLVAASPALVHAQSAVTLYGLVDAGITYTNNQKGASNIQQTSGKLNGSRWGLRGVEDLGDGLKTVFTLESGFRPNDGTAAQGGRLFGRQAFVGVQKTGIGTVTVGRQYEPVTDLVSQYAGPGFWSPSTHIGDNDNLNQTFRVNNAVKFRSDPIAGFTVDGLYAFSNQANGNNGTGFSNNRAWGIAANYTNGPFSIGGGYNVLNHPNTASNTGGAIGGASTTSGDDYSGAFFYGLNGGVVRQQIAAAGTSYAIGAATFGFAWSHTQLDYSDGSSRKFNNYDLNARYLFTPALTLIGVYTYTDGRATNLPGTNGANLKPRWHQFTLGVDYALSKRTDLYLSAAYQLAAGDASTRVGTGYQKIAAIADAGTASSTNRQVAVFSGVRVKF
ncbi:MULTISPECIES: porin [Paraburkholderia]|jgi:GBP family porin|uniref:Porin n=1 Tax=Paraburkholderia largidicola TaxID=3014751 RepID=A0A7I8BQU6_9BURK|nr:porin [Paraburkholderia sp. PGU16]BCF91012.1 porin [Paraburkholderia sp. PGU16]GJH32975.1 porin [Paraburkholderia hospita]